MYFAVSKYIFDLDTATSQDDKQLKSLCEKIRARFKVAVASKGGHASGETAIVVAVVGNSEEKLSKTLDDIGALCEESGFGRVLAEHTLLDHIDTISEMQPDE